MSLVLRCVLDLDGVVAAFVQGVCRQFEVADPYLLPEHRGNYNAIEMVLDWKHLEEDFWAGLPKMSDADEIVRLVEERFGPENVAFLSSPSHNRGCMPGKIRWIREHYPQLQRRFLFGPPKHFVAHPNAVLVDDYDKNVESFRAHGGRAILLPRIWNSLHAIENPVAYLVEQLATL